MCFVFNKKGHIARDCLHKDQAKKNTRFSAGMQEQETPSGTMSLERDRWRSPKPYKPWYKGGNQKRTQYEGYRDKAPRFDSDQTEVKKADACQELVQERPVVYACREDGLLMLASGKAVPVISGGL